MVNATVVQCVYLDSVHIYKIKHHFRHCVKLLINPRVTFYCISMKTHPKSYVWSGIFLTIKLPHIYQWIVKKVITHHHDTEETTWKYTFIFHPSNSKPLLRRPILKHGIYNERINILSELCFNLIKTMFNCQKWLWSTKRQHRSLVRTLDCIKKEKILKENDLFKRVVVFLHCYCR